MVPRWVSTVSAKAFGEENSRFFSRVVTKSAAARPVSPPVAFRRLAAYSASIPCASRSSAEWCTSRYLVFLRGNRDVLSHLGGRSRLSRRTMIRASCASPGRIPRAKR